MPYQSLAEQERQKRPQAIAAPPKTPLRTFGDAAAKTAKFLAAPAATVVGGVATPIAAGVDQARSAIASSRGQELTNPTLIQDRTAAVRDFGLNTLQGGAQALVNAIPVGDTRAAAPAAGVPATNAMPNKPAAIPKPATPPPVGGQAIAAAPQRSFDETNVPTKFARGGFTSAPGASAEISKAAAFVDQRKREREAGFARVNADTDANVANARNTALRNQLQSELNRTPPGGGIQRQGEFRPRGGADPRAQLIAQIQGLNTPVAAAAAPSTADAQKQGAEINAAADKAKADAVQLEAGQLALAGEQRKAALQQKITQLDPNDPQLSGLRANLAVLSGKNPNEGRFESIEEIVGTDAFGSPVKARSLYDTTTGSFIDRGGSAQAKPTQEQATTEAKAAVKSGADKDAVNARLKQLGYPTI